MNKKIAINNFQYTYFLYNRVKKKIVKNELFNKWYHADTALATDIEKFGDDNNVKNDKNGFYFPNSLAVSNTPGYGYCIFDNTKFRINKILLKVFGTVYITNIDKNQNPAVHENKNN